MPRLHPDIEKKRLASLFHQYMWAEINAYHSVAENSQVEKDRNKSLAELVEELHSNYRNEDLDKDFLHSVLALDE